MFLHSSTGGYLGCFYLLATGNNAAINVYICFYMDRFPFLLDICLGVELVDDTVTVYPFQEVPVFQCGCIILHPFQQYMSDLVSPHPHKGLLLSVFFYSSHPGGYKVVLIYISLITN